MVEKTNLTSKLAVSLFLMILAATVLPADTIYVDDNGPADFSNIQAAIDDANDGDAVLVADGIYMGVGNLNLDFKGKAITVRSQNGPDKCIINCLMAGRGFTFHSGEDANSVLDGFTVTNGCLGNGAGIYCGSSSPTIRNCVITGNTAPWIQGFPGWFATDGGGIGLQGSSAVIANCIISNNTATESGGGIWSEVGSPTIVNCIISNNEASGGMGGGIYCYTRGDPDPRLSPIINNCIIAGNSAYIGGAIYRSKGEIANCTICYNSADLRGGGVYQCSGSITNCIIWGNGDDLYESYATYSCIEDNDAGTGNINSDPCFADAAKGDYHLKSQAGRWDANEGRWMIDEVTSLCIDAGDPASPIGLEPFPNGGIINMGAYGGTLEASKSYFGKPPCETIVAGDINGDCIVNLKDFALMAYHWLEEK